MCLRPLPDQRDVSEELFSLRGENAGRFSVRRHSLLLTPLRNTLDLPPFRILHSKICSETSPLFAKSAKNGAPNFVIEEFQTAERNVGSTSLKRERSFDIGCPMFARFWQTWDPVRRQELRTSQVSSQKALAEPGAPGLKPCASTQMSGPLPYDRPFS